MNWENEDFWATGSISTTTPSREITQYPANLVVISKHPKEVECKGCDFKWNHNDYPHKISRGAVSGALRIQCPNCDCTSMVPKLS